MSDTQTIVVLPADFYDSCQKAGLLNRDYRWVRQETIPTGDGSCPHCGMDWYRRCVPPRDHTQCAYFKKFNPIDTTGAQK